MRGEIMIIAPSTVVRILRNVPLDNTYEHTIWFNTAAAQAAYFDSLAKYRYTDFTYQRVNKATIRIGRKADDLFDCNYLMFQNSNFGNKWFYAFITAVEYLNNECCNVTYEIDVMQTWFFDYEFADTFVEREHSARDKIGDNIIPESLAVGEYVFNSYEPVNVALREMAVILAIVDVDGNTDGNVYDGVYGSATLWAYDITDNEGINAKVDRYVELGRPDAVIAMYMCPKPFVNGGTIPEDHRIRRGTNGTFYDKTMSIVTAGDTLNGYRPKNNKLYTYPFNYFHVDNGNGDALSLRYEFFENQTPVLEYYGTITQPVQVVLKPASYKGVAGYSSLGGYTTVNTESLSLGNFPMCSWNVDTYEAWAAQNAVPIALSAGTRAFSLGYGQNNNSAGVTSGIGFITDTLSQMYTASIQADISKGSFNNGSANTAHHQNMFYAGRVSVNAQMAKVIDDYFTMFGYAAHEVKKPNRDARPHWNYVKTVSCNIHGSIPADDMQSICRIYDHGITFWKNGNEIGNYSLDNAPVN